MISYYSALYHLRYSNICDILLFVKIAINVRALARSNSIAITFNDAKINEIKT